MVRGIMDSGRSTLGGRGENNKDPNNSSTGIVSTSSYPGVTELLSKATLKGQIEVLSASHHESRIPDGLLPASH
jgi:hypothetical protein